MENSVLGFRDSSKKTKDKYAEKKIIVKIASIPTKRRLNANSEKKQLA